MLRDKKPWFMFDPLEIAILLTIVVLGLASVFTGRGLSENLAFWGNGLWGLIGFMTQMSLILLGGYMVAISRPVNRLLGKLASLPRSHLQAYFLCLFVSAFSCWCNWGLGLVTGAFFSMELSRKHKNLNFPFLVAISYMGFIFWHGGLSGSIPLTVATPDNFSEPWLGRTLELSETIFSPLNISIVFLLLGSLMGLIFCFSKNLSPMQIPKKERTKENSVEGSSRFGLSLHWGLKLLIVFYIVQKSLAGQFQLGLNEVNLVLILLALSLHGNLKKFMEAATEGCSKLAPILIQYPLYAGIMAIMIKSGLASQLSQSFVEWSGEATYPLYMFLSAGLVNFFVPSGGGQWAVQAPIVIEGAKELNIPLEKAVMAVAWGDAWTNLAQPFWALPLIAIAGVSLKEIMTYCLSALVLTGAMISLCFLLF